jgi:transposase
MCSPIGIDPHKGTDTAAVLDGSASVIDELWLVADRHQRDWLLSFTTRYEPRTWAIEGAGGLGALLAQRLVAAGESVLDGPPEQRQAQLAVRSALYRFVDEYRDWGKVAQ